MSVNYSYLTALDRKCSPVGLQTVAKSYYITKFLPLCYSSMEGLFICLNPFVEYCVLSTNSSELVEDLNMGPPVFFVLIRTDKVQGVKKFSKAV